MKNLLALALLCCSAFSLSGQVDSISADAALDSAELQEILDVYAYMDSLEATLDYQHGIVQLRGDLARLQVPAGYKFIQGDDAELVLTELWGNPPSDVHNMPLGMIIPDQMTPLMDSAYAINITYSEEGYVSDEDAEDIDYDELLADLKASTAEANIWRQENGYGSLELIGWASTPYYDQVSKKLHWAKELNFDNTPENTLNYNIRILGRKGFLEMNVIGGMYVLDKVQSDIDQILASVSFEDGYKYSDFNPDLDKVAAVGIGGLIAGKVLAKAGILTKAGIFLAKAWKIILVAVIGIFSLLKRIISPKSKRAEIS